MIDFLIGPVTPGLISYDIETYPNAFTFRCKHFGTGERWAYEVSQYQNTLFEFIEFIRRSVAVGCEFVGFNNIGFDYPVVHFILNNASNSCMSVIDIYDKAMSIIGGSRFGHIVWESDWIIPQIDLFKIHHFDNSAKSTSLKVLEFNFRMSNIEDLPFDVGVSLSPSQVETLCSYNDHDVDATELLLEFTKPLIDNRKELSERYRMSLVNCSDVKIGEKIVVQALQNAGVATHERINGKRRPRQTHRERIDLSEAVFDYVQFEHREFQRILAYFKSKVITETKGVFKELHAVVDGCSYHFGTGGLHMSVSSSIIESNDTHQIVDVDVASYYPNLAIMNRVYPAHLGEAYCDILKQMFEERRTIPKSDPRNGAIKLGMNGTYGLSNNEYSPIYDPMYTMKITINGQLLLCMLVEQLIKIPGLKMIQANTDGVTYSCPRGYLNHARNLNKWWEGFTGLELEETLYNRMFIRDVNNYIAEKEDGSLKRIGAYAYVTALEDPATRELPLHKDWSARVIQMAAEAHLVRGEDIMEFLYNHRDKYDFLLRTKVPRSANLFHGDKKVQNIVRYFISTAGERLCKVMPPAGPIGEYKRKNGIDDEFFQSILSQIPPGAHDERIHTKNKSVYEAREVGLHTGYTVELCNYIPSHILNPTEECDHHDIDAFYSSLNYQWYHDEAVKLCKLGEFEHG